MAHDIRIKSAAILLLCVSLLVYHFTRCPVVYMGDNGELYAAAYNLGIAHPPGYPLFCLCGKLFSYIPLSNIAYRINVMSSFFAALAAMVFFLALVKINMKPVFSAVAALCFAFSKSLWMLASGSKFYTLHNFLVAVLIYLAALFWTSRKTGYLYLMALISGIALSNHQTVALLGPGLAFAIWVSDRKAWTRLDVAGKMFLLGFFGTLVYLYLPVRSSAHPPINWGEPHTWYNLTAHILRKQYGNLSRTPRGFSKFLEQLKPYWHYLWVQFTPYLLVFAVPGLLKMWKKNRSWLFISLLFFIFPSMGLIYIINPALTLHEAYLNEVFYIPSYFSVALWIGFGLECISGLAKFKFAHYAFLFLPVLPLTFNFYTADRSRNYLGLDFGLNMLKTIEPNGVMSAGNGDNEDFAMAYVKMVEKRRPDTMIFDDNGTVFPDIYGTNLFRLNQSELQSYRDNVQRELVKKSAGPVYCVLSSYLAHAGFQRIPAGILFRIVRQGETPSRHNYWKNYCLRGVDDDSILNDIYGNYVAAMYHIYRGAQYLQEGRKKEGLWELAHAGAVGSQIEWIHTNLGIIYDENGYIDEAISQYQQAIKADPNALPAYQNICLAGDEKIRLCVSSGNAEKLLSARNETIGFYQQLVQIDPSNTAAHYNLGVLYAHTGNIDRSIAELSKIVQLSPDVDAFHTDLGIALQLEGLFEPALREFKEALRCNPKNADARRRLAEVETKLK